MTLKTLTNYFNTLKKELAMNDRFFYLCVTVALIFLIATIGFYKYTEVKSIERNIESAIVKGIDPVAVRCAYSTGMDNICVSYAASTKK